MLVGFKRVSALSPESLLVPRASCNHAFTLPNKYISTGMCIPVPLPKSRTRVCFKSGLSSNSLALEELLEWDIVEYSCPEDKTPIFHRLGKVAKVPVIR